MASTSLEREAVAGERADREADFGVSGEELLWRWVRGHNLVANPACALTTGAADLAQGALDIVLEGRAEQPADGAPELEAAAVGEGVGPDPGSSVPPPHSRRAGASPRGRRGDRRSAVGRPPGSCPWEERSARSIGGRPRLRPPAARTTGSARRPAASQGRRARVLTDELG